MYQIYGYEIATKTVKASGQGDILTVPKAWAGKRVKIILRTKK